jgi:predicted enzyme related to lactoylglutathione lyase
MKHGSPARPGARTPKHRASEARAGPDPERGRFPRLIGVHDSRAVNTAPRQASAVIYAVDLARLQVFYESVCGLEVAASGPTFVTLISKTWELTLVAVPSRTAATIELTAPAKRRTQTPIKLAFEVTSLPSARAAAAAAGGGVDDAEWTFNGALVCDGQDTEGNVVQFRVHPG